MKKKLMLTLTAILLLLFATVAFAADSHPGMITITTGRGINIGSTVYPGHSAYPMSCTFELDEFTMPLESCRMGILNWDCDEDNNILGTREYDIVLVNGHPVGALTGQDGEWNTSYFNVPLDKLCIGENTITIYVGHQDLVSKEIVQDSPYWVVQVDRVSLQFDGGHSENAPDKFEVSLDYATETADGIQCGATAHIESDETRSYAIEYSLVDMCEGSATYGQIIADDKETLTGTLLVSTGHFDLGYQPPMGNYVIECTLTDPNTGEVYASDTYEFNLSEALEGECEHERTLADQYSRHVWRMLGKEDPQYATHHQQQEVYWNICALCGATYNIYTDWVTAEHTLPVCACGYVQPGYNPIQSAKLHSTGEYCVGVNHVITVVTDANVSRVSAENNTGYGVHTTWRKTENADGTITWSCTYKPDVPATGRYWNVTAYSLNNRAIGQMSTNKVDITEGQHIVLNYRINSNADQTVNGNTITIVKDGDKPTYLTLWAQRFQGTKAIEWIQPSDMNQYYFIEDAGDYSVLRFTTGSQATVEGLGEVTLKLKDGKGVTLATVDVVVTDTIISKLPSKLRATWLALDTNYKNAPNGFFDMYTASDALYHFEIFVQEYQDTPLVQLSVATTETVDGVKNGLSNWVDGVYYHSSLASWLDKDLNTAQILVNYLSTMDHNSSGVKDTREEIEVSSNAFNFVNKILSLLQDTIDEETIAACEEALKAIEEASDDIPKGSSVQITNVIKEFYRNGKLHKDFRGNYSSESLMEIIAGIPLTVNGKQYTFGDMFDLTADNVHGVKDKISQMYKALKNQDSITIDLDSDLGAPVKASFVKDAYESSDAAKSKKRIVNYLDEAAQDAQSQLDAKKKKTLDDMGISFMTFLNATLNSVNAYGQFKQYEIVLEQHEKKLRNMLEYSNCSNAEAIVEEVMDILYSTVAHGFVDDVVKAVGVTVADDILSEGLDKVVKNSLAKVLPKGANPLTLFFDLGTDAALLLSDAANNKLKVWETEDLYDNFQEAKQALSNSMLTFYNDPTQANYDALYWTFEYYALLVNSGAKQVSDILYSDANSLTYRFVDWVKFWAPDTSEDQKAYALSIPSADAKTLEYFRTKLFP